MDKEQLQAKMKAFNQAIVSLACAADDPEANATELALEADAIECDVLDAFDAKDAAIQELVAALKLWQKADGHFFECDASGILAPGEIDDSPETADCRVACCPMCVRCREVLAKHGGTT